MDKILLSRILDLEWFGYYAIANVVSMNLYRLFGPIYSAIYPKLVNLVSVGTKKELSDFYHKSAQSLAVAVFPLAIVLIFFSEEILSIWLQDAKTAGFVAPIASILLVGTLINGILHIPYGLQLAFGWTSLALRFGIISIFIYGILLVILTDLYGVKGGAAAWLIQQAFYLLASIPLMHRRILPDDLFNWYWFDVSFPTLLSVLPVATLWLIMPNFNGILTSLLYIFLAYVFSQLLIIFGLPAMRNKARETYNSLFKSLLGEQK